jgi:putative flippase GtrA
MITRDRPAPSIGRQVRTFVAIGIASTLAYAALYALLRPLAPAAIANGFALVATALGNTAANRHFTFGVRGRDALIRDHAAGLAAFGVALLITTVAIGALDALAPNAGRAAELVVLVAANGLATVIRFLLLRAGISRRQRGVPTDLRFERTAS